MCCSTHSFFFPKTAAEISRIPTNKRAHKLRAEDKLDMTIASVALSIFLVAAGVAAALYMNKIASVVPSDRRALMKTCAIGTGVILSTLGLFSLLEARSQFRKARMTVLNSDCE